MWLSSNREGIPVARSTIERLMRDMQRTGARPGRRVVTTRPDAATPRPGDAQNAGHIASTDGGYPSGPLRG
jgi:putative transposase